MSARRDDDAAGRPGRRPRTIAEIRAELDAILAEYRRLRGVLDDKGLASTPPPKPEEPNEDHPAS